MQDATFPGEIIVRIGAITVGCIQVNQALTFLAEATQTNPDSLMMFRVLPIRDKIGALRNDADQALIALLDLALRAVADAGIVMDPTHMWGRMPNGLAVMFYMPPDYQPISLPVTTGELDRIIQDLRSVSASLSAIVSSRAS